MTVLLTIKILLVFLTIFGGKMKCFSKKDSIPTLESSKTFLNEINEMSDNILRNLRPVDNRTQEELIDDQFISIDDRTQQELEDDDYISLDERTEQELKDDNYISINDRTEQELKDDGYISLESDSEVENIDLTPAETQKKPLQHVLVQYINFRQIIIKK